MPQNNFTITSDEVAKIQISTVRELVIKADSTNNREEKVKSLILAFKALEKSLTILGVEVNKININFKTV